jgi:hypothetical protein
MRKYTMAKIYDIEVAGDTKCVATDSACHSLMIWEGKQYCGLGKGYVEKITNCPMGGDYEPEKKKPIKRHKKYGYKAIS